MLLLALLTTLVAVSARENLVGCTNHTCFGDCYEKYYSSVALDGWVTRVCLQQCYRDPADLYIEMAGVLPSCNGTTAHIVGERWGHVYDQKFNDSDYVCGSCKMPGGYGPNGYFSTTVSSNVPNGDHSWIVSLTLDNTDYSSSILFILEDSNHYSSQGGFGFECKQGYKLSSDQISDEIQLLFIEDGQVFSDCLRSNLTKHNIDLIGVPIWVGKGSTFGSGGLDKISFKFRHWVEQEYQLDPNKTSFYEDPDVEYTILTQPTFPPTPSPVVTKAPATESGDTVQVQKNLLYLLLLFGGIGALFCLYVVAYSFCKPKETLGQKQRPLMQVEGEQA